MFARAVTHGAFVLLIGILLSLSRTTGAQVSRASDETGISGYVLTPDGSPASGGTVVMQRNTASLERTGRFRIAVQDVGNQRLSVHVPGFAPYRINITVPASRTMKLPVIRLVQATYFRARFVTADGEPILSPRVRRQSVDVSGAPIPDSPDGRVGEQLESDGTVSIGPLPKGVTMLVMDSPPLAQTRLRDLFVTGAESVIEGGTLAIPPGAVLHVDLVDSKGAPVTNHDVMLEDAAMPSPLAFAPRRTNQQGRASFDRLAAGLYRVQTRAPERCGGAFLYVSRVIAVSGNGVLGTRLVLGGTATLRFTSPFGPMRGLQVAAFVESGATAQPTWLQGGAVVNALARIYKPMGSACFGTTDTEGRVTLSSFPPGATRVEARFLNNTKYSQRVGIPDDGREVVVTVPDGFLPVRVSSAVTKRPVPSAEIAWSSGVSKVEASANGLGEALLQGVGPGAGTLAVAEQGFQPLEHKLAEPPPTLYEVALQPSLPTSVEARVTATSGAAVAGAIVELISANPIEVGHFAVTDVKGTVRFTYRPAGTFQLVAHAAGFVPSVVQVLETNRDAIALSVSRGYRVNVTVESPAKLGAHAIRVVNERGQSMDSVLDSDSDRAAESPGAVSLGPLPPGKYAIELQGSQDTWRDVVQIVDRDMSVKLVVR